MPATHFAANLENSINRRLTPFLRKRGWLPRTISYVGYGNADFARVLGRVALSRTQVVQDPDGAAPLEEDLIARRGWRSYLTAPVGYLPVVVSIGAKEVRTTTDRAGYIDLVVPEPGLEPGWHDVVVRAKAATPTTARVLIVPRTARLGIVSDIDDTALVTLVPRPLIAVWNTFIRHGSARKVVPGMADMYRRILADHPDAPIFYVSTGAWNIMPTLVQFLRSHDFPHGPMLMTDWGPTNSGWFRSGREHKRHSLRRLAAEFPHITWVLVGDDGQHDPSLYREFAEEYPSRVAAIAIRELTPGEQVLAHGSPVAAADANAGPRPRGVPEVTGGDGSAIEPGLTSALRAHRFS